MPDIILPGPAGRIEARYQRQKAPNAPMALILHPHPQYGGTMNNPLVYELYHRYHKLGCTVVRLDWMSTLYPNPSFCWVVGISFGAWIGMQLLMRRPEITGFISIAPQANLYDFAFLAPCPASGLFVHGTKDQVVPEADVQKLVDRLSAQRGIRISYRKIEGANHFFDNHTQEVVDVVADYAKNRMESPYGGR